LAYPDSLNGENFQLSAGLDIINITTTIWIIDVEEDECCNDRSLAY
jgi:hypothetical protein